MWLNPYGGRLILNYRSLFQFFLRQMFFFIIILQGTLFSNIFTMIVFDLRSILGQVWSEITFRYSRPNTKYVASATVWQQSFKHDICHVHICHTWSYCISIIGQFIIAVLEEICQNSITITHWQMDTHTSYNTAI